ncbi:MAG: prepilin-type N-terminal cleavage/methylation domain-containing protein [Candidatus Saccharibacteria bacterium]
MYRRGFTIVELIIVITVMGVLLVLGVVNLRGLQANARDEKRKTDIESIALQLETYYKVGTDNTANTNSYPSTVLVTNVQATLRDADMKSFTAPGAANLAASFIAEGGGTTTATVGPQPTTSQYGYQPLLADGSICYLVTSVCRKFNLYYRLESDNTVYMVTSKNQ